MKTLLAAVLMLSVAGMASRPGSPAGPSAPLDDTQLAAQAGTGFWEGLACGGAVAGAAVGTFAIVGAIGAGTTVGLGAAFAYSVALHGTALCALIE